MITGSLLIIITTIITTLISFLPNMESMPGTFENAWTWISGFASNIVWTLPRGNEFLQIAGFYVLILSCIFIWKAVNWVYNKIRGSGN